MGTLSREQQIHFIHCLRRDRDTILGDSERYGPLIHTLEALGRHLAPAAKQTGLGAYEKVLVDLAASAPSCGNTAKAHRLFELVRIARNEAVHTGARARHFAHSTVRFSLLLDEAMSQQLNTIDDFSVSPVVTIEPWQTLADARSVLLEMQFSFLPVFVGKKWKLLSSAAVAKYLAPLNADQRKKALKRTIQDAANDLGLKNAVLLSPGEKVEGALDQMRGDEPALIVKEALLGIVTPFDLM